MRLSVVAYVPKSLRARLQAGVQPPYTIEFADSWSDVVFLIRRAHVDVLFIDPTVEHDGTTSTVRFLQEFPSVSVILYSGLTQATMKAVKDTAKHGLYEVLLSEVEDNPARIQHLLQKIPQSRLVPLVLFHLRTELARLDATLAARVEAVFENPFIVTSPDDLALFCGLSRSVLYQVCAEVGFPSPKRLIIAARLIRGYSYLRDRGQPFPLVCRKLGILEHRTLRSHLYHAFGMTVSQLRQCEDHDLLIRHLVAWIKRKEI